MLSLSVTKDPSLEGISYGDTNMLAIELYKHVKSLSIENVNKPAKNRLETAI